MPGDSGKQASPANDPVTPTARPKRPPLPSESYIASTVILVLAFVVHFLVIVGFETNPALVASLSKKVSTLVWSSSNLCAIIPVAIYFVIVMWHLYHRSKEAKKSASLKGGAGTLTNNLLIGWNLALASFSMLMLAGLVRGILFTIRQRGLVSWICDGESSWQGDAGLSLYSHIFLLSKFPELFDTAFLVIRGKDVKFLHWYHHMSVLLYCWYVTQVKYPATFFAAVNAFVHSIMYYYYFRMAQGIRPKFAKIVTQIQLIQMVLGIGSTLVFIIYHLNDPSCNGGTVVHQRGVLWTSFGVTGGMYLSYFVLFALFYIDRYYSKKRR
jgi:hypothetical protein